MERPLLQFPGYETYYFANVVSNILHDPLPYLRNLDDIYGDDKFLVYVTPFPKYSAFHQFLEFIIDSLIIEASEGVDFDGRRQMAEEFKEIPSALKDMKPLTLPVEKALIYYDIEHEPFIKWLAAGGVDTGDAGIDEIIDYIGSLRESGAYDKLILQSVKEVFYVLFGNRHALMLFNDMLAGYISHYDCDTTFEGEPDCYFQKPGVLKRQHIPTWVQRAVFFRDRGMCVSCHRDLSGLLSVWSQEQFDHIIPLRAGGLNDVTNIQLLCSDCNLRKSSKKLATPKEYEDWYPLLAEDAE